LKIYFCLSFNEFVIEEKIRKKVEIKVEIKVEVKVEVKVGNLPTN
jgi:hypothetical protein